MSPPPATHEWLFTQIRKSRFLVIAFRLKHFVWFFLRLCICLFASFIPSHFKVWLRLDKAFTNYLQHARVKY
jgi:hypothetical protein